MSEKKKKNNEKTYCADLVNCDPLRCGAFLTGLPLIRRDTMYEIINIEKELKTDNSFITDAEKERLKKSIEERIEKLQRLNLMANEILENIIEKL
jgi:hypothetical protein